MSSAHWLGLILLGCSSARLDPNTRAITFYSPPTTSDGPSNIAGASGASPRAKPPTAAAAGYGGQPSVPVAGKTAVPDSVGSAVPRCSNLPDPSPLRTDHWVELALRFDRGKLELSKSTAYNTRKSETTKRVMGRFAAELWIGCELIDRVRFDFPLLGTTTDQKDTHAPNFEASGRYDAVVSIPDSDRATRLELVDRATSERRILDWPLRPTR